MITSAFLRLDFPVFRDTTRYPDSVINYWLQVANLMLNQQRFGTPAPLTVSQATLVGGGSGYAVNDTVTLAGGTSTQPVILTVASIGAGGAIATFTTTNPGAYTVLPSNPVGQLSTSGIGTGATFNLTFVSAAYTPFDIAEELFVAHNLVLDRKAQDAADAGGLPGQMTGPVSAKSVGSVSVSYDTALAAWQGVGDWNLTIYGVRFARMADQFGMGPLLSAGGCGPPLSGPPFAGPIFGQGIDWDM